MLAGLALTADAISLQSNAPSHAPPPTEEGEGTGEEGGHHGRAATTTTLGGPRWGEAVARRRELLAAAEAAMKGKGGKREAILTEAEVRMGFVVGGCRWAAPFPF